jgi:hypothetical protein
MMDRRLERELLDDLPASDPRAVSSRGDLHRLNALMGHAGILLRAAQPAAGGLRHVVELGAGDGSLMQKIAAGLTGHGEGVELEMVDQQAIVPAAGLATFAALGWRARNVQADVFEWLALPRARTADLMVANLFLHHFTSAQLQRLFALAAERTRLFVACEPRRGSLPLAATRLLWLIGCNGVTRHDAAISVRAGFAGQELSELWPSSPGWQLHERAAGLFSHCFVAHKTPGAA